MTYLLSLFKLRTMSSDVTQARKMKGQKRKANLSDQTFDNSRKTRLKKNNSVINNDTVSVAVDNKNTLNDKKIKITDNNALHIPKKRTVKNENTLNSVTVSIPLFKKEGKTMLTMTDSENSTSVKSATKKHKIVNIPQNMSDVSSNWRKLQKVIYKNHPEKLKRRPVNKPDPEPVVTKCQKVDETTRVNDDVWFDDVDSFLLDVADQDKTLTDGQASNKRLTACVAMDCEMVGVGYGGKESVLARVSMVNQYGACLLDKFVKPREEVSDYRTHVSGITPSHVARACNFLPVQKEVCDLLEGRILVGHAVRNDLKVLYLSHPRQMIRDTSRYRPFRRLFDGKTPSLKALSKKLLGVSIQSGQHNSVEDAQAAMKLYTLARAEWEKRRKAMQAKRSYKPGPAKS